MCELARARNNLAGGWRSSDGLVLCMLLIPISSIRWPPRRLPGSTRSLEQPFWTRGPIGRMLVHTLSDRHDGFFCVQAPVNASVLPHSVHEYPDIVVDSYQFGNCTLDKQQPPAGVDVRVTTWSANRSRRSLQPESRCWPLTFFFCDLFS